MSQAPLQKLGRYILTEKIASGGMADVYRAKLPGVEGFEKEVAIKKILPFWSQNKEFIDMLVDEAKVLLHLTHSNIVQVVELNREEDIYYLVMEYVEGVDLRALLRQLKIRGEQMPLPVFFYIASQICQGLAFAHSRTDKNQIPLQIVHRDISPQNILIGFEGVVKITDFGIARAMGRTTETVTGTLKGKFAYMSPEQALGKTLDLRSDLFAVGILLFEMLTLTPCFKGKNDLETLEAVKNANLVFPPGIDVPHALRAIIARAMDRDFEKRYSNLEILAKALKEVESTIGGEARSTDLKTFVQKIFPEKRHPISAPNLSTQIHRQTQFHAETKIEDTEADRLTEMMAVTQMDVTPKLENKKPDRVPVYWVSVFSLLLLILMGWFATQSPDDIKQPPQKNVKITSVPDAAMSQGSPVVEPIIPTSIPVLESKPKVMPEVPAPKIYGGVRVAAKPWGNVYISGIVAGAETPFSNHKIPVGTTTIRVVYPPSNKSVSGQFEITEGGMLRCQASFAGAGSLFCQ